ncbi:MAG TPA: acyl-ACP--UDP-N-acetylglucosamine O-acyltransferase [Bacteroidota bacterium]|nr:acyl-ACP--UDP-N-acetylglucosamine O-acyltransferase [Bacteroidota bacterium]
MPVQIHSLAVVGNNAQLGENVHIGPFAVVEDDVVIGDGTTIAPHAIIQNGTRLGKENKIASFASVGGAPQDLKYNGEPTILEVGDRCNIREYVTLNRGTAETGKTKIGSDCLFMANAHVGHDCIIGDHCILANSVALGGHTELGNWVIIGGLSPLHQFTHVGDHAIVGGGYRVTKDVPPYVSAARLPLSYEGLNAIGLRRRGFTKETIELITKAYTLLYDSKLNVSQAVARIKTELPQTPEIQTIITFIANSKRGIIGALRHGE